MAVARKNEVSRLRKLLLQMCHASQLIQREPGNALARFLFSSALARETDVGGDGPGVHDPLLPTVDSHDMSICRELQKVNVSTDEAHRICEALCLAGREAAGRLADVRACEASTDVVLQAYGERYKLQWETEFEVVSVPHLEQLRALYATHSTDDAGAQHFNRRVFCLLKRYEAVGGPTYQCSVTRTTFDVLRAEFGVTKECFASPFNRNAEVYWSAFPDTDCFFGSQGSFFTALASPLVQEGGCFFANPPFVEEHMQLLREHVERILELPVPVTFAVVLPTWTDNSSHEWMRKSAYTKLHLVLQPHRHEYVDGRQQSNTTSVPHRHVAQCTSSCFILQNDKGSAQFPVNAVRRRRLQTSFVLRVPPAQHA
jgi:hypothetical protein